MGVTLDSTGVANTMVIATNISRGFEVLRKRADGNKVVIFDAADFVSLYQVNDVILFQNIGSSVGAGTITINSATGGFQEVTITCAAAPTVATNL